jgi:hypothetical protein
MRIRKIILKYKMYGTQPCQKVLVIIQDVLQKLAIWRRFKEHMASDKSQAKENWARTSGLGIILVASDLIVLFIGGKFYDNPTGIIAAVGIMTFFGMLMISSYHKKNFVDPDKGTMRDALAGSLISVYFVILGFDMVKGVQTAADPILNNFSSVIIILIAFYFGSKAVTEIYNIKNSGSASGTTNVSSGGKS